MMVTSLKTLNEVYSPLAARRRYEVWFLRLGLAQNGEAWWFRYLLMNPGRGGCAQEPAALPVQVWATRFPPYGKPNTFIQGFPLENLDLSERGERPFHLRIGNNGIEENSCRGELAVGGHSISWDLQYVSTFRVTLSNKGWIGFSRTPHSDAIFSGHITFDGQRVSGNPLGLGLQGHNCGYRHRSFWTWAHAFFTRPDRPPTTLEALVYDMPFGLVFRKAILWHDAKQYVFRNLQELPADPTNLQWSFRASLPGGFALHAEFKGAGPSTHILDYLKTDCSGKFKVANNSRVGAALRLKYPEGRVEELQTQNGAVLEIAGRRFHSAH